MLRLCTVTASVVFLATSAYAQVIPPPPGGRLTLESGAHVQTQLQFNKNTIYYTCTGDKAPYVPVPTAGTLQALPIPGCEISTGINGAFVGGGQGYDLFIVNQGGVATLCYGNQNWTTGNRTGGTVTHGTNVVLQKTLGYWTNQSTIVNCRTGAAGTTDIGPVSPNNALYVGSFMASGTGVVTMAPYPPAASGGTNTWCGLYNAYNQVLTKCKSQDSTETWITPSGTVRCNSTAPGGGSNNRVNWIDGLATTPWTITYWTSVSATAANAAMTVEVGLANEESGPNSLFLNEGAGSGGQGQVVQQVGIGTSFTNWGSGIQSQYDPLPKIGTWHAQCLEGGNHISFFGIDFMKLWLEFWM